MRMRQELFGRYTTKRTVRRTLLGSKSMLACLKPGFYFCPVGNGQFAFGIEFLASGEFVSVPGWRDICGCVLFERQPQIVHRLDFFSDIHRINLLKYCRHN